MNPAATCRQHYVTKTYIHPQDGVREPEAFPPLEHGLKLATGQPTEKAELLRTCAPSSAARTRTSTSVHEELEKGLAKDKPRANFPHQIHKTSSTAASLTKLWRADPGHALDNDDRSKTPTSRRRGLPRRAIRAGLPNSSQGPQQPHPAGMPSRPIAWARRRQCGRPHDQGRQHDGRRQQGLVAQFQLRRPLVVGESKATLPSPSKRAWRKTCHPRSRVSQTSGVARPHPKSGDSGATGTSPTRPLAGRREVEAAPTSPLRRSVNKSRTAVPHGGLATAIIPRQPRTVCGRRNPAAARPCPARRGGGPGFAACPLPCVLRAQEGERRGGRAGEVVIFMKMLFGRAEPAGRRST